MNKNIDFIREKLLAAYTYFGAEPDFVMEEIEEQLNELDGWPATELEFEGEAIEGYELQILSANSEREHFEKDGMPCWKKTSNILYLFVSEQKTDYILHSYDYCEQKDGKKWWMENERICFTKLDELELVGEPDFM
jgi:hypothetical protein